MTPRPRRKRPSSSRPVVDEGPRSTAATHDGSARTSGLLWGAIVLVVATFVAYWPAIHGGFLFDDDSMLTNSAVVRAGDGLRRIWFTTEPLDYWPLTNSTMWLEWRLWGLAPTGYHVSNLLLHAASALLIWAILRRLSIPGAWVAAMIFALHPVNVESVAWIAQRKNTLSMVFVLASIFAFLRDRYWTSFAAFLLAMLGKGSVATLPAVLLLLIWWRDGEVTAKDARRLAPFFVVAAALTLVNIWFQMRMPGGTRDVDLLQRVLGAGGVVWFYLAKALVPLRLNFIYPQWTVEADEWWWWAAVAGAAAVTTALIWQRHRPAVRGVLAGWIFFLLALLPVMGFTDVYFMKYSLVADHYEYVALIAVAACAGAGLEREMRGSKILGSRVLGSVASAALLVALGVLTWTQAHLYADAETLYRATLDRNPSAWVVHNNLAAVLLERGENEEAARHLREALRLQPDFAQAHNNLCDAAARLRNMNEALAECAAALRNNPNRAAAHTSLGLALGASGQFARARAEFETALRLNPDSVETHFDLADLLRAANEPAAAADHYREALRLSPGLAGAHNGLGAALADLGDARNAEAAFREAIRLEPDRAEPRRNLADLLGEIGRFDEAVLQYREALARDPASAEAHNNLGVMLARLGRTADAVEEFRAALKLRPDLADARANLAKLERRSGGR